MQPVILTHGLLGYRTFLIWELYPGVQEALEREGITSYKPLVHPTASIAERAEQIAEFLDKEFGPKEPVHIVAHSMGGLDVRYLASPHGLCMGDRIISVTTVGTPHQGACIAEIIKNPYRRIVTLGAKMGKYFIRDESDRHFLEEVGDENWHSLDQLTPRYCQEIFNPEVVDHPHVQYYSFAGKRHKTGSIFLDFVRSCPNYIIGTREGENDGLVSIESAKWGEFKGVLPADHGELVGLQIHPLVKNTFDHIAFYVALARDLKNTELGQPIHCAEELYHPADCT